MRSSLLTLRASACALAVAFTLAACGDSPSTTTDDASVATDTGTPVDADAPDGSADAGVDVDASLVDGSVVAAAHDVLFVGNSYVYVNDVPGHYRALVSALSPDVRVEAVAPGGYRLEQHAADARTDGTPLARWLRTGTPVETSFDAVVLQEQSQVGGFPSTAPERVASVAAASELSVLATARGARVVLYLTWGREYGDPANESLGYGTYTGMQDALDEGYLGLATLLRDQGADATVAPVGGAFRTVYEDVMLAGGDPGAEGGDFDALYDADGSHPSVRGAYLASCVIAGTIAAADVRAFVDEPTLGPAVSSSLRDACARALVDPRWLVPTM